MYVNNIRYGFATNSSSTHSVVLVNGPAPTDYLCDEDQFGWEGFICASEEAKRRYLGHQIMNEFVRVHKLHPKEAAIIAREWAGVEIDTEGYVDHQSQISFPCVYGGWYGPRILRSFFDELMNFVLEPNIVIVGGNDNEEEKKEIVAGTAVLTSLMTDRGIIRGRKDIRGNFWTLFSPEDGIKVRFSFAKLYNADKSEVPELVDLKITDYCSAGCRYCYQGSSTKGKHADTHNIQWITRALQDLDVFEVAIGGGEPTAHPDFVHIIRSFSDAGIKPSFSTRDDTWVLNNWDSISGNVGGIGLSVDSAQELETKLNNLAPLMGKRTSPVIVAHVVVGSCSEEELGKIMQVCDKVRITILLLGWKNTHRGTGGPLHEVNLERVLQSFQKTQGRGKKARKCWDGPSVAFDTMIVAQMSEWLNVNSHRWFFTKREGAHSMYIDCCTNRMAQSSYSEAFMPIRTNSDVLLSEQIQTYFSSL